MKTGNETHVLKTGLKTGVLLTVSAALSVEHCQPKAGSVQQKGRLRVQRWGFRVLGFGVQGLEFRV